MTEVKVEEPSFTEFPADFNSEGMAKAIIDQERISREQQVTLAVHLRGTIVAASMAAIARKLTLVRISFNGLIDALKKGKHISNFVYLEHETIVLVIGELMDRFKGRVYAGRMLATEKELTMARTWILLEESAEKEFLPGDDLQLLFSEGDGGSQ